MDEPSRWKTFITQLNFCNKLATMARYAPLKPLLHSTEISSQFLASNRIYFNPEVI